MGVAPSGVGDEQALLLGGPLGEFFRAELQQELVFTASVAADSKNAAAARAFIEYLRTPAASAFLKSKGMTPG